VSGTEHRLYLALVAVHVLSAVVAFGTVFAMPLIRDRIGDDLAAARVELAVAQRVMTPAMGLLLATGVVQVAWGPRGIGEPWVGATLAVLVALFAIAGVLARTARVALAAGPSDQLGFRMRVLWQLAAGLVVAAVLMMVVKPGG
jgi:uncharacterized membrane protein